MTTAALTRERILVEAIAMVDQGGLDALSSRALAERLGVTPMALYRHVRDMDEVLGAAVDHLLAERSLPRSGRGWERWLEELAQGLRDLFDEHPDALLLFSRQPVTSPAARRRLERAIEVLGRDGIDAQTAAAAYGAVHTFTVGFCLLESGRRRAPVPLADTDAPDDPTARTIAGFVTEDGFLHGLRALIDGLAAQADRPLR